MVNKVRVWDLPTRVFHWSLVVCFVGLVITGQIGGAAMDWHFRFGYTVLSLLMFRAVWGVFGGRWSRFSAFVVGPVTILRYLQGRGTPLQTVGHNPLGSLSVLALLAFALLQVATGLISDDEIATTGPLAKMVAGSWVSFATYYHAKVGQYILITLVLLHIAAVVFYQTVRKERLIQSMLTGDKEVAEPFDNARDDVRSRALAAVVLLACITLVTGLVQWAS
ncbi:MAG: cytochrome b/b6 domain-containing protein [Pseudomonadota bacterium]